MVGGAGWIPSDVAWVQLQDFCGLLHHVMTRDPCGRAQQLLSGLMLVDDHVAGGVAAASSVTLSGDDPRSLSRLEGADGLPVQGLRLVAVRTTCRGVIGHVEAGLGPAGTTRTPYKGSGPGMRNNNRINEFTESHNRLFCWWILADLKQLCLI